MKFPFRYQLESIDCGPTCIQMLAAFYGKKYSIREIKQLCSLTRIGISLNDIIIVCNKIGLKAIPIRPNLTEIDNIPLPCILYWRQEHFVVLHKINKNQYYIADPGYGKIKINKDTFIREWLHQNEYGVAIVVAPKEDFFKKKPQK